MASQATLVEFGETRTRIPWRPSRPFWLFPGQQRPSPVCFCHFVAYFMVSQTTLVKFGETRTHVYPGGPLGHFGYFLINKDRFPVVSGPSRRISWFRDVKRSFVIDEWWTFSFCCYGRSGRSSPMVALLTILAIFRSAVAVFG